MKARLENDGKLLIIEGDDMMERMALKGWEAEFRDGNSAFRIGDSEAVQRAEEDVQRDRDG